MDYDTLEFDNLPLEEVAVRAVFFTPLPMGVSLLLRTTAVLGNSVDEPIDSPGVERAPGRKETELSLVSLNGFQLVDSTSKLVALVQSNMVMVKWQRVSGKDYPRYPGMEEFLFRVIDALAKVSPLDLDQKVANMSYTNVLPCSMSDAGLIAPEFWPLSDNWTPSGMRKAGVMQEYQVAFRRPDSIDQRLVFSVQETPESQFLMMVTSAGKRIDGQHPREAHSEVHNSLIDWFPDILSHEARERFKWLTQ